jgi:hypothetical protein
MRALALCLALGLGGCAANGGQKVEREQHAAAVETAALRSASVADAKARLSEQLAPSLSRSSAGLSEVVHEDGRRSLRVNNGLRQAQLARIGADGRVTTTCVDNLPAAERFIRQDAP